MLSEFRKFGVIRTSKLWTLCNNFKFFKKNKKNQRREKRKNCYILSFDMWHSIYFFDPSIFARSRSLKNQNPPKNVFCFDPARVAFALMIFSNWHFAPSLLHYSNVRWGCSTKNLCMTSMKRHSDSSRSRAHDRCRRTCTAQTPPLPGATPPSLLFFWEGMPPVPLRCVAESSQKLS